MPGKIERADGELSQALHIKRVIEAFLAAPDAMQQDQEFVAGFPEIRGDADVMPVVSAANVLSYAHGMCSF
jgi:hypothetical protein